MNENITLLQLRLWMTEMANSSLSEINPNDQIESYKCGFLSEFTDISLHDTVINAQRHCTKRHDKNILLFSTMELPRITAADCQYFPINDIDDLISKMKICNEHF